IQKLLRMINFEGGFIVNAVMADLEREQIRQRQREGIEIAKKEGKYLFEQLYRQWKAGDITQQYS
ncbi:MAG: recombinase family protein, partial [Solobacterium sp.]|nr:recombinase family protein [Solobacterium sp.]